MSATVNYPHLDHDAEGRARIAGTRYKVLHLAGEHYHYGWSADDLLDQHPDLRPEQIYAALTYFYDHHEAMVRELNQEADQVDRLAAGKTLSRASLLKRREARAASQ